MEAEVKVEVVDWWAGGDLEGEESEEGEGDEMTSISSSSSPSSLVPIMVNENQLS